MLSTIRIAVKDAVERETQEAYEVARALRASGLPRMPEYYFESAKGRLVSKNIGTETEIPVTQQLLFDSAVKLSINPWAQQKWERYFGITVDMAVALSDAGLILPVLRHKTLDDWSPETEYLLPLVKRSVCPGIRYEAYLKDNLPVAQDYEELRQKFLQDIEETLTASVIRAIAFFELTESVASLRQVLANRFLWLYCTDLQLGEQLLGYLREDPIEAIKASRILYESEIMPVHTAMCGTVSVSRQTRALYGVPSLAAGDLGIDVNDRRSLLVAGAKIRSAVTALVADERHWPIAFEYFPETRRAQTELTDKLLRLNSSRHTALKDDFNREFHGVVEGIDRGTIRESDVLSLLSKHKEVCEEITRQNERLSNMTKGLGWGAIALVGTASAEASAALLFGCGVVASVAAKIFESPAISWLQSLNRRVLSPEQRLLYAVEDIRRLP